MTSMSFKGVTAASLGVVVLEYPPIVKPAAFVTLVQVPGRSGTLTLRDLDKVYEPVSRVCRCRLLATASPTAVAAWLDGSGALILGNEPLYQYTARVGDEIRFDKILPNHADRVFDVTFVCQPWKELATPGADITLGASPQTIVSAATLDSLPLITIAGTGAVSLNVGSYSFSLTGLQAGTPVLVDCDAMTATNVGLTVSYMQNMTGPFPKLVPGNNLITYSGTVTSIVIRPRYRWL